MTERAETCSHINETELHKLFDYMPGYVYGVLTYNPVYIFVFGQVSYLYVGVFSLDFLQPTDIWSSENRVEYGSRGGENYHDN
jgi:hypothetical protein